MPHHAIILSETGIKYEGEDMLAALAIWTKHALEITHHYGEGKGQEILWLKEDKIYQQHPKPLPKRHHAPRR